MPTLRQLSLLLAVTFVAWIGPWGISLLFGDAPYAGRIAFYSIILTVPLLTAGLFLGVLAWHRRPEARRKILGLLAGFLLMAFGTIALGVATLLAFSMEENPVQASASPLVTHLEQSLATEKDPARLREIAQGLYNFTGTSVSYRDADGRTVTYQPTEDDQKRRAFMARNHTATADARALAAAGRQSAIIFIVVYVGAVIIGLGGGLVVGRRRKNP